jgi:type I restriction enzyme R subunit
MPFEFYNPQAGVAARRGNLPHWFQPGVTYFITFRTEDSVPQSLIRAWNVDRDRWLIANGFNPKSADWRQQLRQKRELEAKFEQQFSAQFHDYLDCGLGRCELRDPACSKIVADTLHFFDGSRYFLGDFVVMPNHVHLLCCLIGETEIEAQCRSWKKFAAKEINALLGRKGRFWQEESFDHLVRSADYFDHLRSYIAENPVKARLKPGEFFHYQCS